MTVYIFHSCVSDPFISSCRIAAISNWEIVDLYTSLNDVILEDSVSLGMATAMTRPSILRMLLVQNSFEEHILEGLEALS
jgi:hypothetical protein